MDITNTNDVIRRERARVLALLAEHGGSLSINRLKRFDVPLWAVTNLYVRGDVRVIGDPDDSDTIVELTVPVLPKKNQESSAYADRLPGFPSAFVPHWVVEKFREITGVPKK
ncbi:MAG: hypothetical protein AAB458_00575 [Patescibacteria group bacterium]